MVQNDATHYTGKTVSQLEALIKVGTQHWKDKQMHMYTPIGLLSVWQVVTSGDKWWQVVTSGDRHINTIPISDVSHAIVVEMT